MKYFTMWYNYLHQKDKDRVKKLIKNGQLEITQGGWTASDEACPNYQDLILNMHLGHKFLQDEFGVKPRIGWMLDSFGHS
jgi:alpha-mannosidase